MNNLEDNLLIKRLEEGQNTKVMLMSHNAYWYQLMKLERIYSNFSVDTFGSGTAYVRYRKGVISQNYDFIILDGTGFYSESELHEIKEMTSRMSEENNKRISAGYAYSIPIEKRTSADNSRGIKIVSYKNGVEDEITNSVSSGDDLLTLANMIIETHNDLENQKTNKLSL